jgi:TP53 regulating kinase-like protein
MTSPNIIQQGAEAIIIHEGAKVIKDRVSKKYRHPELDKKIIKTRTKKEAKLLEKVSKLIPCPLPTNLREIEKSKTPNQIEMPFVKGKKLSENLEQLDWKAICKTIGNQIAKVHDANIIHGDLTTSNMILSEDGKLYFIDFGLGFTSRRNEDKAVDLHLIKQALEAKHFSIHKEAEKIILENYNSQERDKTLEQLKKVESRGRYKHGF